jgi:hypothetical protein
MAMHTGESIQLLCRTLGVSRAGFYAHRHKARRPRRVQDRKLAKEIGPSSSKAGARTAARASRSLWTGPANDVARTASPG